MTTLFRRSNQKYNLTAITLHWVMALLIIGGFSLGWVMTDLSKGSPIRLPFYSWHKTLGVTIFVLALIRILWRISHKPPSLPSHMNAWERFAANVCHYSLYILMVAIPLTGYSMSSAAGSPVIYFGLIKLPVLFEANTELRIFFKSLHYYLNYIFLALFIIHILSVIKHQLFNRDKLLSRILPFSK